MTYTRPLRRAQTLVARIILVLAVALAVYTCAGTASARPVTANAALPPDQRCALLGTLAQETVQGRLTGYPEQDLHLNLDGLDPEAGRVIHSWYSEPSNLNTSPDMARAIENSQCLNGVVSELWRR